MNKSHKLHFLEGLRGIAALIVVVCHLPLVFDAAFAAEHRARPEWLPASVSHSVAALVGALYNGHFAVWLFWIMSAFVLSLQFFLRAHSAGTPSAHDYLEDAAVRRYPRLLIPVLASVVLAYAFHSFGWMFNTRLTDQAGWPYNTISLSQMYDFAPGFRPAIRSAVWEAFFRYDPRSSYNLVLWTMGPEFYGSLFLFAFLGVFGQRRSRIFAYLVLVIVITKLGLLWLDAFVAGIWLCDVFVNHGKFVITGNVVRFKAADFARRSPWLAILLWILILIGVGRRVEKEVYDGFYLLLAFAAVALALVSLPTQRTLSKGIPVFLGKISFALYLVHLPLICSFTCWAYLKAGGSMGVTETAFLISIATVGLAIAAGYGLYLIADRPSLAISRWFSLAIRTGNWRLTDHQS